jgi:hypothetical protein
LLPIISEEIRNQVLPEILKDIPVWRKTMIHYIKEENPELNAAIIEIANNTSLDPKAVALGAYMSYKMIEIAADEQNSMIENILD